jgi:hypothetical protein
LILGIMSIGAILFLLSLLYRLSVNALPFWGAMTAGWIAWATGAGPIGAGIVVIVSAGVFIGLSDAIYASLRTRTARAVFAAPFAAAGAFAGYHASRGILGWSIDNPIWLAALSGLAALATGTMAWLQLAERASALSGTSPHALEPPKPSTTPRPPTTAWPARPRRR